eukprot:TRINITY_DN909_c0_g1_i1.p1 TRINITY_DN909_c0_g1~~TRINITY_DN909_c0_g1_i1.p1  ORF type:complete len:141 (+),score=29.94 TRINITY_DN909_c0_g1_i1:52-474(+)
MKTIAIFSLFLFFASCFAAIEYFPVEDSFALPANAKVLPIMEFLRRFTPNQNRGKRAIPVPVAATCAADAQDLTVYKDTTTGEWYYQNCGTTPLKPVFQFSSIANIFAYEDCIPAKTRKYIWWMRGNPTLTLKVTSKLPC